MIFFLRSLHVVGLDRKGEGESVYMRGGSLSLSLRCDFPSSIVKTWLLLLLTSSAHIFMGNGSSGSLDESGSSSYSSTGENCTICLALSPFPTWVLMLT